MDIFEMKSEIEDYLKEIAKEQDDDWEWEDIDERLHEFADGHRATIYSDLELFQHFEVSAFEDEVLDLFSGERLTVSRIVALSIYLYIVATGVELVQARRSQ